MLQITLVGSIIGEPTTIDEMLECAAVKGIKPWLNKFPMKECPQAAQYMRDGKAKISRYSRKLNRKDICCIYVFFSSSFLTSNIINDIDFCYK